MDVVTRRILDKGKKNAALLIQSQYPPLPVEKEIALICIGTKGLLYDVPAENIHEFAEEFLEVLEVKYRKEVLDVLKSGMMHEDTEQLLVQTAIDLAKGYK